MQHHSKLSSSSSGLQLSLSKPLSPQRLLSSGPSSASGAAGGIGESREFERAPLTDGPAQIYTHFFRRPVEDSLVITDHTYLSDTGRSDRGYSPVSERERDRDIKAPDFVTDHLRKLRNNPNNTNHSNNGSPVLRAASSPEFSVDDPSNPSNLSNPDVSQSTPVQPAPSTPKKNVNFSPGVSEPLSSPSHKQPIAAAVRVVPSFGMLGRSRPIDTHTTNPHSPHNEGSENGLLGSPKRIRSSFLKSPSRSRSRAMREVCIASSPFCIPTLLSTLRITHSLSLSLSLSLLFMV